LVDLASTICDLSSTGLIVDNYGSLVLTGSGSPSIEVFNIDGATLCSSYGFSVNDVSSNASVFFNVFGASNLSCGNFEMTGFASTQAVWTFCDASYLTLENIGWIGSILAPNTVMQNSQGGSIGGQVFVQSWDSNITNCMQQNWEPFVGCIPSY